MRARARATIVRATAELFLMTLSGSFLRPKLSISVRLSLSLSPPSLSFLPRRFSSEQTATLRSRLLYVPTRRVIIARDRPARSRFLSSFLPFQAILFFFSLSSLSRMTVRRVHVCIGESVHQLRQRRSSPSVTGNPAVSRAVIVRHLFRLAHYNCACAGHKIPIARQLAPRHAAEFPCISFLCRGLDAIGPPRRRAASGRRFRRIPCAFQRGARVSSPHAVIGANSRAFAEHPRRSRD